ncbi:MAG: M23 family metallopeptidase [Rubrivivax sp.]|nr:M23 family metallopeptidase [Rubrivivax sp.]
MSFVMIAAGPSSSSRVRTLPLRALLSAAVFGALGLLATGVVLGYWMSQQVEAPLDASAAPTPAPFAVEQLGTLSGRLFTLESQAGQLSQRIGLLQGHATRPAAPAAPAASTATARGVRADSGGPMLPPRPEPEGLDALQARLASLELQIERVADAASLQNVSLMRLPTRPPLDDVGMVSAFGNRDDPFTGRRAFHAGIDFAAPSGTTILAAAGGTVAYAGTKADFGKVVEIDHGNGLSTRYAHASALWVKTGDLVAPGDAIAAVGSTGRSTGAHLHFEVLRQGEAVNPRRYLAGL